MIGYLGILMNARPQLRGKLRKFFFIKRQNRRVFIYFSICFSELMRSFVGFMVAA
ncbi:hypothetical protein KFK09_028664 [Dendrobium nobile]|uniref:Uncharacterized protein n=1 Tax=Dendrobium nobile TaxID=94219 RepID=A0A8T3A269_DENNO|nr:hypothetical protein KFK09_028664 [Dendrobium nobile]